MRPLPYIIIADTFPDGAARAAVLNHGADACVETPLIADEVLAIVNAVLRREQRLARLKLGRMLPRRGCTMTAPPSDFLYFLL